MLPNGTRAPQEQLVAAVAASGASLWDTEYNIPIDYCGAGMEGGGGPGDGAAPDWPGPGKRRRVDGDADGHWPVTGEYPQTDTQHPAPYPLPYYYGAPGENIGYQHYPAPPYLYPHPANLPHYAYLTPPAPGGDAAPTAASAAAGGGGGGAERDDEVPGQVRVVTREEAMREEEERRKVEEQARSLAAQAQLAAILDKVPRAVRGCTPPLRPARFRASCVSVCPPLGLPPPLLGPNAVVPSLLCRVLLVVMGVFPLLLCAPLRAGGPLTLSPPPLPLFPLRSPPPPSASTRSPVAIGLVKGHMKEDS